MSGMAKKRLRRTQIKAGLEGQTKGSARTRPRRPDERMLKPAINVDAQCSRLAPHGH